MNKYVSSILKTICALIVLFNAYIASITLERTDDDKYNKSNFMSYTYVIPFDEKRVEPEYTVLETFIGSMTGYGADCIGCSGRTSYGHSLITDGIYYQDKTFGEVRIVAADKKFTFGTILRISGLKIYDEPFLAVVLDRGGAIKGTKMDLAFTSESDPLVKQIGYSKNIQYEILRYGW